MNIYIIINICKNPLSRFALLFYNIVMKFILIFLYIFSVLYCSNVYSDKLFLKGSNYELDVDIKESNRNAIVVAIQKNSVTDISVTVLKEKSYPDSIKLKCRSKILDCKVLEIKKKVVVTLIPMNEILSFDVTLAESSSTLFNDVKNKNSIVSSDIENRNYKENIQNVINGFGNVKGTILSQGVPLQQCQVKIVRLIPKKFIFLKKYKQANQYETITNSKGIYVFNDILVGEYKLYWKTSIGEPWMSRIEKEPDIIVFSGKMNVAASLDIDLGIIGNNFSDVQ